MELKYLLVFGLLLGLVTSAIAAEPDALALLKRDLGEAIEVHSKSEIRYCPDNTCEIYKATKANQDLAAFVYLHLFYESGYYYLSHTVGDKKAFRQSAIEEPKVRAKVASCCPSAAKEPSCVLKNMKKKLGIKICQGRYDEGHFCYGCSENENICKKL
ncbi:MAG: hypothetical protein PXX77_02990 [Gallionella sp.]|nr:hypothetical protein [Gallionella sp.]